MIDETGGTAPLEVTPIAEGGKGEAAHLRIIFSQPLKQIPAGPVRQVQIAKQNIEIDFPGSLEGGLHIVSEMHRKTADLQKTLQRFRRPQMIFDHENADVCP